MRLILFSLLLWANLAFAQQRPLKLSLIGGRTIQRNTTAVHSFSRASEGGLLTATLWQCALQGTFAFNDRWAITAQLGYAGFRRGGIILNDLANDRTVHFIYHDPKTSHFSGTISAQLTAAHISRYHLPLKVSAGVGARYFTIRYNTDFLLPDDIGVYNQATKAYYTTVNEDDLKSIIFIGGYGGTLAPLHRITPAIHLGLSLEGLVYDRIGLFVAADKDLLPYQEGHLAYEMFQKDNGYAERNLNNRFFLQTFTWGMSVRVW